MAEPINGLKSLDRASSKDWLVFLIYLGCAGIYFFPVFFLGKSLLIDALDHSITYIRMVERAHWLSQGIIPLWDPKTFSGLSLVDTVPPTHLLNLQSWVMALFGDRLGYNLCVLAFVVFGAFGTYLLCQRRLLIDWRLSVCAGISVAFGPMIGNTYSSMFTFLPFISYFLYYFWIIFEERKLIPIVRAALCSAFPLALSFYSQDPRYIEEIFYSTVLLALTAIIIFGKDRNKIIRNYFIFGVVSATSFIILIIPILLPLIFETFFNQQRLGSGQVIYPIFQYPNLSILASIVVGNFFPINPAVLHDGIRGFVLGSYFNLYFEYIHILFYGAMAIGITIYSRLRPIERCLFLMPVLLIGILYLAPYFPGLMYLNTLIFKTGRFPLAQEISNFYGVVAVFLVLNKIIKGGIVNLTSRAASFARMILTLQMAFAVMAVTAVLLVTLFGQSFLFPYVRSHAAALIGSTKNIDHEMFDAIFKSFLQRVPFLLLSFIFLAMQIWLVKRLVFSGPREQSFIPQALLVLLFITPFLLSAAYWPFNNIVDRTDVKTADRQFLSSLNVLDRVDNVDLYTYTNLTPEQHARVISLYSPNSLKWAIGAFPPAVMDFVQHFIPKDMYQYFHQMYVEDKNLKNSLKANERFFFSPNDNNLFHLIGINYIFSELDLFSYPFVRIGKFNDYFIYNNIKAFPRFYFADKVTMIDNDNNLLNTLYTMPYNDLRREAFIASPSSNKTTNSKTFWDDGRLISVVSYTPNLVTVHTQSSHDQFLVITDTYSRRWKVFIDDKQTELYKTNFLFRGVAIPPGKHNVKFIYYYPEFKYYILITIIGLMFIFLFHKYTE